MKLLVVVLSLLAAVQVFAQDERLVFEAGGPKGWSMFPHIQTDTLFCAQAGNVLRIAKGNTASRGWFWMTPSVFNDSNDFRIETRLRQIAGDIYNGFGIAYGYQDPQNYASFMISSWKQAKYASALDGRYTDWRDMLQVKAIRSVGEFNTLVFEKKNNEVTLTINDTMIFTTQAARVIGKGIGFLTHSSLAFEVEYLRLYETAKGKLVPKASAVSNQTLPNATMRFHILFESGRSEVNPSSFGELNQVLGFLRSNPRVLIDISGHSDDLGSVATNLRISEARANAVKSYLVTKGIAAIRMTAKGYGKSRPVVPNTSAENRQKNRRVEFFVHTAQ